VSLLHLILHLMHHERASGWHSWSTWHHPEVHWHMHCDRAARTSWGRTSRHLWTTGAARTPGGPSLLAHSSGWRTLHHHHLHSWHHSRKRHASWSHHHRTSGPSWYLWSCHHSRHSWHAGTHHQRPAWDNRTTDRRRSVWERNEVHGIGSRSGCLDMSC